MRAHAVVGETLPQLGEEQRPQPGGLTEEACLTRPGSPFLSEFLLEVG